MSAPLYTRTATHAAGAAKVASSPTDISPLLGD